jgi:hypothetical protein
VAITASFNMLTLAVKSRLIRDLGEMFRDHPVFGDELAVVNTYGFEQRIKYGIVVKGASAETIQQSPDNWMGNMRSHVSLAKIKGKPGTSLEWVTEDTHNLYRMVENEDVTATVSGQTATVSQTPIRKPAPQTAPGGFSGVIVWVGNKHVEPSHIDYERGVLTFPSWVDIGNDTVLVTYQHQHLALPGYYVVTMDSPNTFTVTTVLNRDIKYPPGFSVVMELPDDTPETVVVKVNGAVVSASLYDHCPFRQRITFLQAPPSGVITVEADALPVTWTYLQPRFYRVGDFPWHAGNAYRLPVEPVDALIQDTPFRLVGDRLYVDAPLPVDQDVVLLERVVPVGDVHTGTLFGTVTNYDVPSVWAGSLRVQLGSRLLAPSEFSHDPATGKLQLLTIPQDFEGVWITYAEVIGVSEPFAIEQNFHTDNQAIPGVILHFAKGYQEGDQQVVIVTREREMVARVHGGMWRQTLSLDLYSMDTLNQDYLLDETAKAIWMKLKPIWDAEGWTIERLSPGGEAEESYEDSPGDMQYTANFQVTVLSDWEVREPIAVINRAVELGERVIYQDGAEEWQEFRNKDVVDLPFDDRAERERWSD